MRLKGLLQAAALAGAALMIGGADGNWAATVAERDGGHVIGNPEAPMHLTEYVSYTCPHCAEFTREGEDAVKLAYVQSGRLQLEVRHLIRDPVDLTAALLTNCGAAEKFPLNHRAFMLAQDEWMAKALRASEAQKQRWRSGAQAERFRSIASDLDFYAIMERRGYTRSQADRCIADEAMASRLAENSARDWDIPGITGTPAFAIDGVVLTGTHNWSMLEPQLKARF